MPLLAITFLAFGFELRLPPVGLLQGLVCCLWMLLSAVLTMPARYFLWFPSRVQRSSSAWMMIALSLYAIALDNQWERLSFIFVLSSSTKPLTMYLPFSWNGRERWWRRWCWRYRYGWAHDEGQHDRYANFKPSGTHTHTLSIDTCHETCLVISLVLTVFSLFSSQKRLPLQIYSKSTQTWAGHSSVVATSSLRHFITRRRSDPIWTIGVSLPWMLVWASTSNHSNYHVYRADNASRTSHHNAAFVCPPEHSIVPCTLSLITRTQHSTTNDAKSERGCVSWARIVVTATLATLDWIL